MAGTAAVDPGHRGRADRLRDRRHVPVAPRPRLQAARPARLPGSVKGSRMFRWYAINTYSGHENKVKTNLEHRIDSMNQHTRFRRVVVPPEEVSETNEGHKVQTGKRVRAGP